MDKTQFTLGDLHDLYLATKSHSIKKIKITSEFANYIEKTIPMPYKDESLDGCYGKFIGIPVELDDTIDGYYKLEY